MPCRPRPFLDDSLTKGCTVERIEVPSAATKPLRERRIAPACAPGPHPLHAASEEALLVGMRAFLTLSRRPPLTRKALRVGSTR